MIIVQMSTQSDWESAAIRWATRSDWSHIDVVWGRGQYKGFLLGARMEGGVLLRPPDYATFAKTQRFGIRMNKAAEKRFYDFLEAQEGKPYDWCGILNFAINRDRDWRADDSWFCSELVAAALEAAGHPILQLDQCDRVSPRDITLSLYLEALL